MRYSDNSQGIPNEAIDKIFEPFFTTNRQGGGSGLGLHIVYNLVTHKFNGTIHCESVMGKGTTFTMEIPLDTQCSVIRWVSRSPPDAALDGSPTENAVNYN